MTKTAKTPITRGLRVLNCIATIRELAAMTRFDLALGSHRVVMTL